jgi:predicted MFS family arabinose efflux permease
MFRESLLSLLYFPSPYLCFALLCFAFAAIPSSFTYLKPLLPEKLGFDSKITSQASNRPSNLLKNVSS